jgi:integrase
MANLPTGFTQLPSGSIRWRVNVAGIRYTGTEDTLTKAKTARARAQVDGGGAPRYSVTVDELLSSHLETAKRARTTIDGWTWAYAHLPATFLARPVGDVSPPIVAALWRQLLAVKAPPHRLLKTANLCSTAWHEAELLGLARSNPWRVATPPRPAGAEPVVPPSPDDVRRLLELAGDRPIATWLRLAARTGARGGEICGLQWDDIRLDRAEIVIARSITRRGEITSGKTGRKGHRVVPIDLPTVAALRRLERVVGCPWVWTFDQRNPWRPDRPATAVRRICDSTKPKEGDEPTPDTPASLDISPHDLRHFAVTQWLADGVPIPTVAELIGDNPKTVLDTYAHWIPAQGRAAVDALGRMLDERAVPSGGG